MTATVLDASVLIAAMHSLDVHHQSVSAYLKQAVIDTTLYVPALNLAEALVGQVRCGRGTEAAQAIKALGIAVIADEFIDPLALASLRVNTGLKLPDCVLLAAALHLNANLATTDKALAKAAQKLQIALAL
ncbi:MAG: type II toxin-antitoxin system VapC family toxin [Propionibacteriaceae bacterium]|nr:type II toxin-antitoxin system VapC family toxin [Propionibacteriaceae bacterium]